MKKIILSIVLLITTICSFAQVNPKIEKLCEQIRSNDNDVYVTYVFDDDINVRYFMPFCRYNIKSETDSISPPRKRYVKLAERGEALYESTLRTLEELESDAAEYYCYQNNVKGEDTCYYSMVFGDFENSDKIVRQEVKNQRYYSANPEWLSFSYIPNTKGGIVKGYSSFQYSKKLGINNQKGLFDVDDYEKKVLGFLNNANVEKYDFYMIDSVKLKRPEDVDPKILNEALMQIRTDTTLRAQIAKDKEKLRGEMPTPKTETFGTVYKMTQKEAFEFVTKISAGSKEYFQNNPSGLFMRYREIPTGELPRMSVDHTVLDVSNQLEYDDYSCYCSYTIYVSPTFKNNIVTYDNYYIGIFRQKGYCKVIPTDWQYIKSSIYGQVEYRENPEDEKTDEVFEIEILE